MKQTFNHLTIIEVLKSTFGHNIQRAYDIIRDGVLVIPWRFKFVCLAVSSSRSLMTGSRDQRYRRMPEYRLVKEVYNAVYASVQGKNIRRGEE